MLINQRRGGKVAEFHLLGNVVELPLFLNKVGILFSWGHIVETYGPGHGLFALAGYHDSRKINNIPATNETKIVWVSFGIPINNTSHEIAGRKAGNMIVHCGKP